MVGEHHSLTRVRITKAKGVIGIGASAGGLEALQALLQRIPKDLDQYALIVAQHVSPSHKSMLTSLLAKDAAFPVKEAYDGLDLEGGFIYITPPDSNLTIHDNKIVLNKPLSNSGPKPSVNLLFESMAENYGPNAVGIVLSGTGTDGSSGISMIRKKGGITVAQEPDTAKFPGMPEAAINTGLVDLVLPPESIFEEILLEIENPDTESKRDFKQEFSAVDLIHIFRMLAAKKGTDFSGYKQATILRRVAKRLNFLGIQNLSEYILYLENNPIEFEELFESLTIGVTSFFRDEKAFKSLRVQLEKLCETKKPGDSIRIWSAGCSTGEEAYSLANMIFEIFGDRLSLFKIQIFATDINEKSITKARKAVFAGSQETDFEHSKSQGVKKTLSNTFEIPKNLRSLVIFTRHDIIKNPPFLTLDLIVCRNLLIYFDLPLQQLIIPMFHYALNPNGLLFLGKSENIGNYSNLFSAIDTQNRIFQRRDVRAKRPIRLESFQSPISNLPTISSKEPQTKEQSPQDLAKEQIFQSFDKPYILTKENFEIVLVKGSTTLFLTIPEGVMNSNLVNLIHPDLKTGLRFFLSKSLKEKANLTTEAFKFSQAGKEFNVCFQISPIFDAQSNVEFILIVFDLTEVKIKIKTKKKKDAGDVEELQERIKELEKELLLTKNYVKFHIEDLEKANKEMQIYNEEIQSANEEMQSSNEELETSIEELQAANEEIQIAYSELKMVNENLEHKDRLLEFRESAERAILNSSLQSFVLTDKNFKILTINEIAVASFEKFFNSKPELGDSVYSHLEKIIPDFVSTGIHRLSKGEALRGESILTNRTSSVNIINYNITPVINSQDEISIISFSFVDVSDIRLAEKNLYKTENLIKSVFEAVHIGISILDKDGKFITVNTAFLNIFGYTKEEIISQKFNFIFLPELAMEIRTLYKGLVQGLHGISPDWKARRKNNEIIDIFLTTELLTEEFGEHFIVMSVRDVSEKRRSQNLLNETQAAAHVGGWEYDVAEEKFLLTVETAKLLGLKELVHIDLFTLVSLFPKSERERFIESFEEAVSNQFELNMVLKLEIDSNRKLFYKVHGKPLVLNNRILKVYGYFQDITERIERDTEIFKTKELLEQTNQIAKVGGWEVDYIDSRLTWTSITKEIHEVDSSYNPDIASAINFYKEGSNRERILKILDKLIKTGEAFDEELVIVTALGNEKWARIIGKGEFSNGVATRAFGAIQDITNIKKEEEQLKLLESVIKNTTDMVLITEAEPFSLPGPRIVYANESFYKFTGFSPEEVIGSTPRILQGEKTDRNELAKIGSAMRSWKTCEAQVINYKKNGEEYWNHFTLIPLANEAGWYTHWIAIERDITAKKLREEERERLVQELTASNIDLRQFAYITSHNLRGPLSNLTGALNLIDDIEINDSLLKQLIEGFRSSTNLLNQTVNDLIKILIIKDNPNVNQELLSLTSTFETVSQQTSFLIQESKIGIFTDFSACDRIIFSKPYLESIFVNFLTNSIKYRSHDRVPELKIKSSVSDQYTILEFTDNGLGIDLVRNQGRIFGLYQRFHNLPDGKGLGLYLVKSQVEALGGKIEVESVENMGTTFRIYFKGQK